MANIQLQLHNIIQLAEVTNTQLAKIKTTILQVSDTYKIQTAEDIFSISKDLQNIIQGDMEKQAHYIQVIPVNRLGQYKGKEDEWVKGHIKIIQEAYQESYQEALQLMNINKGKQKEGVIQEEKVFLYKLYNISSENNWPKTPELMFI